MRNVLQDGRHRMLQSLQEEYYTMKYDVDGKHYIALRLPGKGKYEVDVNFQFPSHDDGLSGGHTVAAYQIENLDTNTPAPFPQGLNKCWGVQPKFSGAGFEVLSPKSPIIETKGGKAIIKMKCPSKAWFPATYSLIKTSISKNTLTKEKYDGNVYGERNGSEATFYVNTPGKGEYKFSLSLKYEDDGDMLSGFREGACFLIKSETAAVDPLNVHAYSEIGGPNMQFYEMGLRSSSKCSTLKVIGDQAELKITKTKPASFHARLECVGIANNNVSRYLKEKANGDTTTYIVSPREPGVYTLKFYVAEEGISTRPYGGMYVIPYKVHL